MAQGNFEIRSARLGDLPSIEEWLAKEARGGEGFIHNWDFIVEAANEGQMLVLSVKGNDEPVAFLTFGLSRSSILQVRTDQKRRGIGRSLVEHAIVDADSRNEGILVVQCQPKSSVYFWRGMGFQPYRTRPGEPTYMYRLLPRQFPLDVTKPLIDFEIRTFPSSRLYRNEYDVHPDRVQFVQGQHVEEGRYRLSERVYVVDESALQDAVVEVLFEGNSIFLRKVKHDPSEAFGFNLTGNRQGWFADSFDTWAEPHET